MKKMLCMLLALAMTLCAAGAWADTVIHGSGLEGESVSGAGWQFFDYSTLRITESGVTVKDWGTPENPVSARIILELADMPSNPDGSAADVVLTLENVHIQSTDSAVCYMVKGFSPTSITLNVTGCTLKSKSGDGIELVKEIQSGTPPSEEDLNALPAIIVNVSGEDTLIDGSTYGIRAAGKSVNIDVDGEGAVITGGLEGILANAQLHGAAITVSSKDALISGGTTGIEANASNMDAAGVSVVVSGEGTKVVGTNKSASKGIFAQCPFGSASVTLGANVTVESSGSDPYSKAVSVSGKTAQLLIDGDSYPGIAAYAGDSAQTVGLVVGSPFSRLTDVKNLVDTAKFIRTGFLLPQIASPDLPQIGDSSCLARWLALLALAGAGMMMSRKREA